MARNKLRILLSFYSLPKHHTIHTALLITNKIKNGAKRGTISARKWHVKNTIQLINHVPARPWRREREIIPDIDNDLRLLACAVIAKVYDIDEVERLINSVPVYQPEDVDQDMACVFDSNIWAKEAMKELRWENVVKATLVTKAEEKLNLYIANHPARWNVQSGTDVQGEPPIVPIIDMFTGKMLRE
ncbi:hypothetical protein N7448_001866 [Penicillium atrosanguineum]|uniref:Uncharacterized protein n=1 Tax=Penicillium atrosanguineum TaxID=1132637 RepID=A0A9W9HJH2_9EURO|nr:uncharacterized protein N7443_005264 [Penicillium atrosanguineum]KAJ5133105.1 hypothetical protein N7526_004470 [Penicillium atrosanguineum]KAJ5150288.1 hypothetical protein N7448_001866 [Penicillium atrosanguineum]KAJ5305604.1 hypothetical protein N7443_005264 [Penicillium atrosanguineum]KAJ5325066.1 hypothetical protein N7476_003666 [Penicillium atrosanguineum]